MSCMLCDQERAHEAKLSHDLRQLKMIQVMGLSEKAGAEGVR